MANGISAAELSKRLTRQLPTQILDVRRRTAYDSSPRVIIGARWRNPEQVNIWMNEVDKGCPVVVYCVHGHQVSQGCAQALAQSGFEVNYLEGGIEQWLAEGHPVQAK